MSDDFLSQEEINLLMEANEEINDKYVLTEDVRDLLGEVGNISMATAATALSTILNKKVSITTPEVETTTLTKLQENLTIPNVVLQVKFEEGLQGTNILLINVEDASVIANLMMGGDGTETSLELSELELSAVSEAMNQMIGSASTAMSTMLKKSVNILPPNTQIWDSDKIMTVEDMELDEDIIKIAFRMTVEGLIDSKIMQVFTVDAVEDIVDSMMNMGGGAEVAEEPIAQTQIVEEQPINNLDQPIIEEKPREPEIYLEESASPSKEAIKVNRPQFGAIEDRPSQRQPRNIDLIMDVPLEFSVVLGKTQKAVKDILSLSPGSVVELNKFAEEPLDVYVNGKLIAQGEVVVINENFGIRITNIISATERIKNIK